MNVNETADNDILDISQNSTNNANIISIVICKIAPSSDALHGSRILSFHLVRCEKY